MTGDTYVTYDDGTDSTAEIKGAVKNAVAGEVVRLYAQQFPFTSAAVPAGLVTLNPAGGASSYAFRVTPTLATRYQVKLFATAAAANPVEISAVTTIYVTSGSDFNGPSNCTTNPVCHEVETVTVWVPPSLIRTEMAKHVYAYLTDSLGPEGTTPPKPASIQLGGGNATVSGVRKLSGNSYSYSITFTYSDGNDASSALWDSCQQDTEAQDGLGLPGSHGCGQARLSATSGYLG